MKPKVIALAGPTASGKTKMAIDLAKQINGEVISADSRYVYKGFDIASAKPTKEEQDGIPHHLIDIVEPEVDYSVADFYDDAKNAIYEILERGKTPIVAGGTGLYFRVLLETYDLPRVEANPELDAAIKDFMTKQFELQAQQMMGQQIDSEAFAKLQQLSAILMQDPSAAQYLQNHMRFSMMMADVYKIIADVADLGVGPTGA